MFRSNKSPSQRENAQPRRRTLESYLQEWQRVSPDGGLPWPDVDINPTACVFGEMVSGTMTSGTWFRCFEDFGELICYVRYYVLPNEQNVSIYRSPPDPAKLQDAEEQLDALLQRYATEGYSSQLVNEFARICDAHRHEREIGPIYILPYDLPAVLEQFGNPLVDDADEDDADEDRPAGQPKPAFDEENPAHWDALRRRIDWCNENWA